MTRYLDRALSGVPASPEDWNEHVTTFHATFPGITPRMIGRFRNAGNETSYRALALHVRNLAPSAQSVLDIGCGSGELLAELQNSYGSSVRLAGIDLCSGDLEAARKRLERAEFVCGDASSQVPAGPFDVVVAHLTFLAMTRLRTVLSNIAHALRPKGLLAFVIEDLTRSDSVLPAMISVMRALQRRFPNFAAGIPDREPFETEADVTRVLEATGFTGITVERSAFDAPLDPDELARFTTTAYPFGLLNSALRAELHELALSAAQASVAAGELSAARLPLMLVTATRGESVSS